MKKALVVFSMLVAGFPALAAGEDITALLDILLYPPGVEAVYPGDLAPDWPQDLVIPLGAELAGSLTLADGSLVAAFSVPQALEDFAAQYVGKLQGEGWVLLESEEGEDGDYRSYSLQRGDSDILGLVLYEKDGPTTYAVLYYGSEVVGALRTVVATINEMFAALIDTDVLPAFEFPGAETVDDAVSPMPLLMDQQTYHAVVSIDADAVAVRELVEEVLERSGWAAMASGDAGSAAWSTYRTEREGTTWEAVILVLPLGGGNSFFVTVHARRISPAE